MNKKTIVLYLIMIAGVILAGYFGPWWAPAAYVVILSVLMQLTTKTAVFTGMISVGLTYLLMSVWMNSRDHADVIEKTGMLLGGLSPVALILVTTLIGAVTGLLAGWVGGTIAQMFKPSDLSDKAKS
jgi:hypothetical protein